MLGIVFDTQERKGQGARSNAPAFLPGIVFDTQERKGQGAKSNVPAFLPGIIFNTQEGGELCCVQGNFPLFAEVSFSIPKSEKTTFRSGYGATALCGVSFSIPKKEKDKARKVMYPHFCRVLFSIPKRAENFVVCRETSPCLLRYRFRYLKVKKLPFAVGMARPLCAGYRFRYLGGREVLLWCVFPPLCAGYRFRYP